MERDYCRFEPEEREIEVSAELQRLAGHARVLVRRDGSPDPAGRCVVYWMQRALRIADNPALDVAIEAANLLELPVVVFFSVIPNYPNANLRHYHFLQQALRDAEQDAAERGVGFVVRRHPDNSLEAFLAEAGAALSGMEFSNAYGLGPAFSSVTKSLFYTWATFYYRDGSMIPDAGSSHGRGVIAQTL